MKRKLFVLLAIAGICFEIMSCSNPSSSDDYTTYKVEVGVISQSTYNTALSKISYWGEVSYSNIASLRLYLYNNTISDHEVQTNVSLSEINVLKTVGNDIVFGGHATDSSKKVWMYATK